MDPSSASRLLETLDERALVVDVGGGAAPFPRADYVLDAISFADRCQLPTVAMQSPPRYRRETWVQVDLCDRRPWPVSDKQFDFATCSHLLEDIRDPVWVCAELSRIAKAGYIEVPSRIVEQSLGVEHPCYAGYYHHRWLVSENGGELEFRHKPHMLHSTSRAIVAKVGIHRAINPQHAITTLWWTDRVPCREVLEFSEEKVVEELCAYAGRARRLPNLTVSNHLSLARIAQRATYFTRLRMGRR